MKDIYKERLNYKPFEYDFDRYRQAIRLARWDVEEFDFNDDIQDFNIHLNDIERNAIKNTMLAISQVESATVKEFWKECNKIFPKPEVAFVGITFAENELTHSEAYSKLLEILGFNSEFDLLLQNPVISGRVNYLNKYLKNTGEDNPKKFQALRLILFTLFVENVSLFSQFAIIKSFRRHKNYLKSIDNVVLSTQKDELVHAKFGIELINIIKSENPSWFDDEFYERIYEACKKAYKAEEKILNWIFEKGELDFLKLDDLKEFTKHRFNDSLVEIGAKPVFKVDSEKIKSLRWFIEEIYGYVRNDFFNTKSANYNKILVKTDSIVNAIRRVRNELV